jgi:molybdenum cofactor biosynthesis protein MoaC
MIDIGDKAPTFRRAVASGNLRITPQVAARISAGTVPKGDVLALAEIAGVQAAKKTADWLPLCHPLLIDKVIVQARLGADGESVEARAEVSGTGKTGFEMEAMTAVGAALLCAYDLLKGLEPALTLTGIRLLEKEGGKSGHWRHPDAGEAPRPAPEPLREVRCAVLTVSDRVSRGIAEDVSGPVLAEALRGLGAAIARTGCVADDRAAIEAALRELAADPAVDLAVLTGGTGLGPRDVTPEAVAAVCDRMVPGLGECLRAEGSRHTPFSWLSRSVAGLAGRQLIVALPGSPKAVREGVAALGRLLPHALHVLRGGDHGR